MPGGTLFARPTATRTANETFFHFIQITLPIHFTFPLSFVKSVTSARANAQKNGQRLAEFV